MVTTYGTYTKLTAITAVVVCVAPSAVCNVLPHIVACWHNGSVDSAEATVALFQGASVIVMASMPLAIRNISGFTGKIACFGLGVILLGLNLLNAIDLGSHSRDTATGQGRELIAQAEATNRRLVHLRESRAQVPSFTLTSAASASAAQSAVDEAVKARDLECASGGKVGPRCRSRMDEASEAQRKLTPILEQRSLTERAEKIDSDIAALEAKLATLGVIPKHSDDTASKIAMILGLFTGGHVNGGMDEAISEWRPIIFAVGVELMAFIGPLGMLAACGGSGSPGPAVPAVDEVKKEEDIDQAIGSVPVVPVDTGVGNAGVVKAALAPTPPTPATTKKPRSRKALSKVPCKSVGEWRAARTVSRDDGLLRCKDAFAAYVEWCQAGRIEPVSLTVFGTTMKGPLKVPYLEKSKRGFYTGLALAGGPALKIVSGRK